MADVRAHEDGVLQRIFAVTLQADKANPSASPPVLGLGELARELEQESDERPVLLTESNLDRVLVSRLIEGPPEGYPQTPFHYLLGCYERASSEARAASGLKDAQVQARVLQGVTAARDLIISYTSLLLTGGIIPEPEAAAKRGVLQFADALLAQKVAEASLGGFISTPQAQLPSGFLEDFAAKQPDSMREALGPVVTELASRVERISPLGDYQPYYVALRHLVSIESLAEALVALPSFRPDLARGTGRALHLASRCWLGPFLAVSALPDQLVLAQPSVREQCFSNFSTRRGGDMARSMSALRDASQNIYTSLHGIAEALLRKKATKPAVMAWLGNAIEGNSERAKLQMNPALAASHGLFVNLCALLLRLCAPFVDPSSPLFWKRADARYLAASPAAARVQFVEDTKLAATADEHRQWRQQQQEGAPGEFHFICELFFLTYKALHLGVAKLVADSTEDLRRLHDVTRVQAELEAAMESASGTPMEAQVRSRLAQAQAYVNAAHEQRLCVETVLGDPKLLADVLAFYRLAATWLLRTASGSTDVLLPLPLPVPPAFANVPEFFIEDLAELLLFASRMYPQVMVKMRLDELMQFLVVFVASPAHVRSPYLRSKLSEVLAAWLPPADDGGGWRGAARTQTLGSSLAYLYESHALVVGHLVPAMLQLYVDVETTDRANQFYLKFNMRQYIGDVLAYLWGVPAHRDTWRRVAAQEGGRGVYLRFANVLINDSIYLLDESLKKLKDLRELEISAADPLARASLSPAERAEREAAAGQSGEQLRSLLLLATSTVRTLAVSTQEVQGPFLLPEMVERVAAMLNYFLLYLTGPERRKLRVKDAEKYNFRPLELLGLICEVYLHLASADGAGAFAAAVAGDKRSYRPAMFSEAASVLRQKGAMGEGSVCQLESLAARVAAAAQQEEEEDEVYESAPDEFLDPITCSLMRDPVIVPTSNTTYERASIMRHLLSDQRDPMNREHLTPDMLIPDTELRTRIRDWQAQQRANRAMKE